MIRENTQIGNNVKIGTNSVIEGNCTLGNNINIQSNVFIPTNTIIGNDVFIGPGVVMANDKYPPSGKELTGPRIRDNVVIGAHVTLLPGVILNRGCAVAAGAIVTKNVSENKMAMGTPARSYLMPTEMVR
jgi:acetyltransferase-like isoleucine patch superfamily enzyme